MEGGIVLKAIGKKVIVWEMLCCFFLLLNLCEAFGEISIDIQADEWSWDAGEVSYFHGGIHSDRDIPDANLKLEINTGLSDSGEISFTVLNGKKLKVRKQGPVVEAELKKDEAASFEGKWLLPYEPERDLRQAVIELTVTNGSGEVLASESLRMGTAEESAIPAAAASPDQIILLLLAASVLIWLTAVGRHLILNRKTT